MSTSGAVGRDSLNVVPPPASRFASRHQLRLSAPFRGVPAKFLKSPSPEPGPEPDRSGPDPFILASPPYQGKRRA